MIMRRPGSAGFALASFTICLPLFLAVAGAFVGSMFALRAQRSALHECRTAALATQAALASGLDELVALNPEAERLRREIAAADALARTAPELATRTAAAARATALRLQQIMLDTRQRGVIVASESRAAQVFERGRAAVARSYSISAREFDGRGALPAHAHGTRPTGRPPRMRLEKRPPNEPGPSYFPSPRAESEQIARLAWAATLFDVVPEWMPLSDDSVRARAHSQCASTVIEKEGRWSPRLAADKP